MKCSTTMPGLMHCVQAERLLGGDPGADSARVEQFFNQAAHVHGRGLGSIKQRPSQGETLDHVAPRSEGWSAISVLPLLQLLLAMAASRGVSAAKA